jgi:Xaa-Pro dipeptidase
MTLARSDLQAVSQSPPVPHLPEQMDDDWVRRDAAEKLRRLRLWLSQAGLAGVLLSRRDNFAWATAGGDSRVLNNSEAGFGHLLVTPERHYLLAHSMDAARLFEEQVPGQGYELVTLRWHQGDPRQHAQALAGGPLAADLPLEGAQLANQQVSQQILHLHYPLTELELQRSRWLGHKTGTLLEQLALQVAPGMSEASIARRMQAAFMLEGIDLDVAIVGSDERIFRYRHPLPTRKPVSSYLLLHPAARRWGLHANVSRSVHFGPPPPQVERAYRAAATLEARLLSQLKPGLFFARILELQKEWYAQLGFPDEWEFHFQGGPTGYVVVDAERCRTGTGVQAGQAFDWFITVTGAKVEELSLLTGGGIEIASQAGGWPSMQFLTEQGPFVVPALWVL